MPVTESAFSLKQFLIRAASGSFLLKLSTVGLTFVSGVVLARVLGVEQYGTYAYALAWVAMLSVPASLGLNTLLVREVAVYVSRAEWGLARGLLRWANGLTLVVGISVAALAAALGWYLFADDSDTLRMAFVLCMVVVPLETLTLLRQGTLKGLRKVVLGQLPEAVVRPLLMLIMVGGAYLYTDMRMTAVTVAGFTVAAYGLTFLLGAYLLLRVRPRQLAAGPVQHDTAVWRRAMLPMMVLAGAQIITEKTDVIMLGAMVDVADAGIYNVARRGASLVMFTLVAVNAAVGPVFAELHAKGDRARLQSVLTKSAQVVLATSVPPALALIVWGEWFLGLFGQGFVAGYDALVILCVATVINAAMGSVALLLVMTGYERIVPRAFGVSAVLNVVLNALLIPRMGVEGAALATAISMMVWNLTLVWVVWRRLGMNPTALRWPRRSG